MKKPLLLIAISALFIMGCENRPPTADDIDQQRQEKLQLEAQAETGLPSIHNWQEKKMIKMLYELRDNPNLINYAYLWSEVSGKWIFLGKCVGYGMPYATQYSNPQKYTRVSASGGGYSYETLPQAEPNGLFMPSSAEGTWIMLINPDKPDDIKPVYVEPRVIVSPFKLPNQ